MFILGFILVSIFQKFHIGLLCFKMLELLVCVIKLTLQPSNSNMALQNDLFFLCKIYNDILSYLPKTKTNYVISILGF